MNARQARDSRSWARRVSAAVTLALATLPALAITAPVDGTMTLNGKPVALTHVLAKLHDNAEGVVTRPLLIAVTDRQLPAGALDGIGETVAAQLAMAGKLRGVLFRIDPKRPDEASMIVLDKPERVGGNLKRLVVGSKEHPAVSRLLVGSDKVGVAFMRPAGGTQDVDVSFALKVAAPLTREPRVTADIKGPAIQASPHYRASLAYAEAMRTGDMAAQDRLGSKAMVARMSMYPSRADIIELLKGVGEKAKTQLPRVHRIVERGDRAVLLIDERAWITMVRENGAWKSGD